MSSIVKNSFLNSNANETAVSDPSALYQSDVRRFAMQHCDAKAAARRNALEASKRKSGLISNMEKLAGIEGTGVVQEALDAIVSATHVGGTEWENIVNAGAEGVLTTVLGDQATNVITGALDKLNPHGVNTAVKSAKQIYDKVKERDFDWKDIPQYVADFKNLYGLGKTVVDPFLVGNASTAEPVVACTASPYAMDLVRAGAKFKFLFVIDIELNPAYQALGQVNPAFAIKSVDRPSMSYDYEDINMYNFRTKVLKKAVFNPLNVTFYDDEQNTAVAFYNAMMRLMSPIATHNRPDFFESEGMAFGDLVQMDRGVDSPTQGITSYNHSASIGPLLQDHTSIIKTLRIHHVYMSGQKMNTYTFHRPRIVQMTLDGLDMTDGEITTVSFEFAYDGIDVINNNSDLLAAGSPERDRQYLQYPIGGHNINLTTPAQSVGSVSTVIGSTAELLARGESFADGVISNIRSRVGSLLDFG